MTDVREAVSRTEADVLLRDYHDARRREDQWRIPQILLALATPIFALIAVVLDILNLGSPTAAGALAVISGTAAALLAIQVWRWHRIALSRVNEFRTSYPEDAALLMKDPI
ncbi:MAG TPA: hypothetical protein VHK63_02800 [Candidatus Limnocylindria bacterium]|nr:hypothetical protein [Candidatus Limnocylindria bacterium]